MDADDENAKKPMPVEHVFKRWLQRSEFHNVRVQMVALVEMATLAGWYVACNDGAALAAVGALVVGTFVSGVFCWLIEKDQNAADVWRSLYERGGFETPRPGGLRQRYLIRTMYVVLGAVNIALLGSVIGCGCPELLGQWVR